MFLRNYMSKEGNEEDFKEINIRNWKFAINSLKALEPQELQNITIHVFSGSNGIVSIMDLAHIFHDKRPIKVEEAKVSAAELPSTYSNAANDKKFILRNKKNL